MPNIFWYKTYLRIFIFFMDVIKTIYHKEVGSDDLQKVWAEGLDKHGLREMLPQILDINPQEWVYLSGKARKLYLPLYLSSDDGLIRPKWVKHVAHFLVGANFGAAINLKVYSRSCHVFREWVVTIPGETQHESRLVEEWGDVEKSKFLYPDLKYDLDIEKGTLYSISEPPTHLTREFFSSGK